MGKSKMVNRLAAQLSWVFALILVLLPFYALLTTWAGSNFGDLDIWRVWPEIILLAALPFSIGLVWLSKESRTWLKNSWIVRFFVFYVLLHIGLGVWALNQHHVIFTAFLYAFIINLRFIGFFILCVIVSLHSDFLKKYWQKILLIPGAIVISFGILQKLIFPYDFLRHFGYSNQTIPPYQTVDANLDFRRIQSTLRGANPLGAYLSLIIPGFILALRKNRKLLAACLLAAFYVLFYSYSRSAVGGIVLALLLLLFISGGRLKAQKWTAAIASLLIIVVGGLYYLRSNQFAQDTLFHTSKSSSSPQSSNQLRFDAIKRGANDVFHQPIGRGPGTAGPASFRNFGQTARIAEDYYLQIGQEVGVIGILIFLTINFLVARQLWFRRQDPLAQLLLISLFGLSFINLVSHAWTDDTIAYIWWGLAGVALAPLRPVRQ